MCNICVHSHCTALWFRVTSNLIALEQPMLLLLLLTFSFHSKRKSILIGNWLKAAINSEASGNLLFAHYFVFSLDYIIKVFDEFLYSILSHFNANKTQVQRKWLMKIDRLNLVRGKSRRIFFLFNTVCARLSCNVKMYAEKKFDKLLRCSFNWCLDIDNRKL